jgi:hypothetical protein
MRISLLVSIFILSACGGDSDSTLRVALQAEDTITEGLEAGDGDEAITDGWAAQFEQYAIVLGQIELAESSDPANVAGSSDFFAFDLVQAPPAGETLWQIEGVDATRYAFAYQQAIATDATFNANLAEADFTQMVSEGCTYLIEGSITQAGGRTCPPSDEAVPAGASADADGCYANESVSFNLCASSPIRYGPCELDGMEGVVVSGDGSDVALTIHGDHIFFNGFPEGEEGGVMRQAQWLADCDLNLDGEVTQAELESVQLADLAAVADFELGGAPAVPGGGTLDNAWDYVRTQLATQGHLGGEGECATSAP